MSRSLDETQQLFDQWASTYDEDPLHPAGPLEGYEHSLALAAALVPRAAAHDHLGRYWDDQEDYPLVGDLDTLLRGAGLRQIRWRQTALCHWAVLARR